MTPNQFVEENKKDLIEIIKFAKDTTQRRAMMVKCQKMLDLLTKMGSEYEVDYNHFFMDNDT